MCGSQKRQGQEQGLKNLQASRSVGSEGQHHPGIPAHSKGGVACSQVSAAQGIPRDIRTVDATSSGSWHPNTQSDMSLGCRMPRGDGQSDQVETRLVGWGFDGTEPTTEDALTGTQLRFCGSRAVLPLRLETNGCLGFAGCSCHASGQL